MIFTASLKAHDVELRFVDSHQDGDFLFIDIQMRASTYDFSLAGHNLRAFYDYSQMELIAVSSNLSPDRYSLHHTEESIGSGKPDTAKLPFEENMAFINMTINLNDSTNGGDLISTEWRTIHQVKFKVKNNKSYAHLAWAVPQVTDVYATAFVEVAEWLSPNKIAAKNVFDLVNFEKVVEKNEIFKNEIDIQFGPNPSKEYVGVTQPYDDAILQIININGAIVSEMNLEAGKSIVDVSNFNPGTYVFYVFSADYNYAEQIIVAE